MISVITDLLAPFLPYIAGALALVGGWFVAKRQGAKGERAKHKAKAAEAKAKTIEEVLRETVSDDPADDIRERMRKRAKQP